MMQFSFANKLFGSSASFSFSLSLLRDDRSAIERDKRTFCHPYLCPWPFLQLGLFIPFLIPSVNELIDDATAQDHCRVLDTIEPRMTITYGHHAVKL